MLRLLTLQHLHYYLQQRVFVRETQEIYLRLDDDYHDVVLLQQQVQRVGRVHRVQWVQVRRVHRVQVNRVRLYYHVIFGFRLEVRLLVLKCFDI